MALFLALFLFAIIPDGFRERELRYSAADRLWRYTMWQRPWLRVCWAGMGINSHRSMSLPAGYVESGPALVVKKTKPPC
jgi:hypothetical protein